MNKKGGNMDIMKIVEGATEGDRFGAFTDLMENGNEKELKDAVNMLFTALKNREYQIKEMKRLVSKVVDEADKYGEL
jgi:hypothetical protein